MTRSSSEQYRFRRDVFAANKQHDSTGRIFLVCYVCNIKIDPASEFWDADHVIPHAFGGKEGKPICKCCHKHKTATEDVPKIAKAKRTNEKHFGVRRKRPWPSRKFNGDVRR